MEFSFTSADLYVLAPLLVLALGAFTALMLDLFVPRGALRRGSVQLATLVALVAAIVVSLFQYQQEDIGPTRDALGPLVRDVFRFRMHTVLGALILEGVTLLSFLLSLSFLGEEDEHYHGEYHALLLLFPFGAILMISAKSLMLAFLGLETFSVALYVLVAARRARSRAVEAGLKYFLLGAFAAAVFLYGAALIYAGNGSLAVPELGQIAQTGVPGPQGLAAIGGALLFVALFFKASVAPFHMWTPDVYEGAPTPITALMSTGTKTAAFVLLCMLAPFIPHEILPLIPVLTVASILVGNVGALLQTDLKRLLAYSGIAHAGYLLVAYSVMVTSSQAGAMVAPLRAILYYLAIYGVTNLAALGVVAWLERREPGIVTLDGLRGLWRRNPFAALVLAVAALSLAGIPPTAGFWASTRSSSPRSSRARSPWPSSRSSARSSASTTTCASSCTPSSCPARPRSP
ncbi:MAG: NADH-quinone oxidoreductase subunit N [Planctomycetota bacterium]